MIGRYRVTGVMRGSGEDEGASVCLSLNSKAKDAYKEAQRRRRSFELQVSSVT